MKLSNAYFINGDAYAGKSTMVRLLAQRHGGIACGENYHDQLAGSLDSREFPCLTYTKDLQDWREFIRRSPEEYAAWVEGCTRECAVLELRILEGHVLIMLADPSVSVNRFFQRPDREKQFLYQLLMQEEDPQAALENFRQCLRRINSQESYDTFLHAGFPVLLRDDSRTVEETLRLAEEVFGLRPQP